MKFKIMLLGLIVLFSFGLAGCQNNDTPKNEHVEQVKSNPVVTPEEKKYTVLPDNIKWLTNESDPVFSSEKAQKGGILHSGITSFPMTFRVVGPDSNGSFRSAILDNQLSLINIHPNTDNIIPELATHWAFGNDKKPCISSLTKMPDGRMVNRLPRGIMPISLNLCALNIS